MKRTILRVFFLVILTFSATGCQEFEANKAAMYDDEAAIVADGDSYFTVRYFQSSTSKYVVNCSFGSFSGTRTLWVINSEEGGTFTVRYDAEITEEDFKLVLIDPDKNVQVIFENSATGEQTFTLSEGKYVIKYVGSYAQGELDVSMRDYENVTVSNLLE